MVTRGRFDTSEQNVTRFVTTTSSAADLNCVGELDDTWIDQLTFQLFHIHSVVQTEAKFTAGDFVTGMNEAFAWRSPIRKGNDQRKREKSNNYNHFPVETGRVIDYHL